MIWTPEWRRLLSLAPRQEQFGNCSPIEFKWEFEYPISAKELWPIIRDTERLNRAIGLAQREHFEADGKQYGTSKFLGVHHEWWEKPWNWQANRYWSIEREFVKGFFHYFRTMAYMEEAMNDQGEETVRLYFYTAWYPKVWNFWIRPLMYLVSGFTCKKLQRFLEQGVRHRLECRHQDADTSVIFWDANKLYENEAGEEILAQFVESTKGRDELNTDVAKVLVEFLKYGDELELNRIKPKELAHKMGCNFDKFLQICLHATRDGILHLSWDSICPHCRGPRQSTAGLGDMELNQSCVDCDLDFKIDSEEALELTFRVDPLVRDVPDVQYCSAGSSKKQHILAQRTLAPGEIFKFTQLVQKGAYRIRMVGSDHMVTLPQCERDRVTEVKWDGLDPLEFTDTEGTELKITLENNSDSSTEFILEEEWWRDESLSASEVLACSEYRDYFENQILPTSLNLEMGVQAILFTDIVGSTKFYEETGDVGAFNAVKAHFEEVYACIDKHHGTVVKTIGDAVMAAFVRPEDALKSAIEMQEIFYANRKDTDVRIRVSIHRGPIIAVNYNVGLDYFGATVNYAAKLQACAETGEISMSDSCWRKISESKFYRAADLPFLKTNTELTVSGRTEPQKVVVLNAHRRKILKAVA